MKKPHAAAPVIETQRLRLRAFEAADFSAFCALWNDPAVYRYITGKALHDEDHWSRLLKLAGHWQFVGFGSWVITDRMTGELIGQCGFNDYRREIDIPMPEPELGWVLRGDRHGKGLGYEATSAAIRWFENEIGARHIACIIDPRNAASLKLAAKLGFEKAAETHYKGKPTVLLRREERAFTQAALQDGGGRPL